MFCTARFGYRLIHSNEKWFRYDLVWEKSRKVGFLNANKQPLRQHENIYVFNAGKTTYNPQKTPREKDYKHSGKRSSEEHYGNVLDCKKVYKKEDGKHPSSVITTETLYPTYNPQKTPGKPYKAFESKKGKKVGEGYGGSKSKHNANPTGDRHPTSVIKGENMFRPEGAKPLVRVQDQGGDRHPTSVIDGDTLLKYKNP